MMKAKQRELQRQLAKTLLQNNDPQHLPVVAYKRDRMHLSQDILTARALKEPAVEVHKRNPHTTYLSQIESFIVLINEVAASQEAAKARAAKQPQQKARPKVEKSRWSNAKNLAPLPPPVKAKKPLRVASTPKARLLPSGAIIIK